jgi:hypothetical protein
MASHLAKFGWRYVVVDIQWAKPYPKTHGYRMSRSVFMPLCSFVSGLWNSCRNLRLSPRQKAVNIARKRLFYNELNKGGGHES